MGVGNDFAGLSEYIIANQNSLYRLAFSYMQNEQDALDMVSEAIVSAYESYGRFRRSADIKTWVYRILVNKCIDTLRKRKRESYGTDDEMLEVPFVETAYDSMWGIVSKSVEHLPEKYRTVIILKYYEECTFEEIAKITGVNVNTVKTRLYAALEKLKQMPGLKGVFVDG